MKKVISLFFAVILVVSFTTGCGCKKKEENKPKDDNNASKVETSTNEGVIGNKEVEVFKFENTSLIYDNGNSFLETTVTNTSDEAQTLKEFLIHVKDKDDKEIVTLSGFIGDSIAAHESKVVSSTYADNLVSVAHNITYEILK